MRVLFTILFLSMFFCACDKPDPQPELKDPVYKDLQEKLSNFEKQLKYTREEEERLKGYIEDTHPHDPALMTKWRTYYMNEKAKKRALQQVKFAKIALEKRKKEVRIRYLKAYKKGEPEKWQDDFEFSAHESRMTNNSFMKISK